MKGGTSTVIKWDLGRIRITLTSKCVCAGGGGGGGGGGCIYGTDPFSIVSSS